MSILIKGMEMPKPKLADMATVYNAYVLVRPNGHAVIVVDNENGLDSTEYPLVPVPPHGRCIDADAFIKQKTEQICENCDRRRGMKDGKLTKRFVYAIGDAPCRACGTGDMLDYVDDAPTIIPADPAEEAER